MRLTDFWERMDEAFGPGYSRSWAHDVVLPGLGMTVDQSIAAGISTRDIWRAVCAATEIPGLLR